MALESALLLAYANPVIGVYFRKRVQDKDTFLMASRPYPIRDGVTVIAPESLTTITPYVLAEQGDWYEDEVRFFRALVTPGMQILDIGASYGQYTLPVAAKLQGEGRVWAFEPCASIAECLRESILTNRYTNIELVQAGLSNRPGDAYFYNRDTAQSGELVTLLTLDRWAEENRWPDLDIIRIDLEGDCRAALDGALDFFRRSQALVMCKIKRGDEVNRDLVNALASRGWSLFRLVPELNLLVPFTVMEEPDGFLLNLFCCKPEKQQRLAEAGFLVNSLTEIKSAWSQMPESFYSRPYMQSIFSRPEDREQSLRQESPEYLRILTCYEHSRNAESFSPRERMSLLAEAVRMIKQAMMQRGESSFARLGSYARILAAFGDRTKAVTILNHILSQLSAGVTVGLGMFTPAEERFESLSLGANALQWFVASVLHKSLLLSSHSSFFNRTAYYGRLETMEKLGFLDEDLARRKKLIESLLS